MNDVQADLEQVLGTLDKLRRLVSDLDPKDRSDARWLGECLVLEMNYLYDSIDALAKIENNGMGRVQ